MSILKTNNFFKEVVKSHMLISYLKYYGYCFQNQKNNLTFFVLKANKCLKKKHRTSKICSPLSHGNQFPDLGSEKNIHAVPKDTKVNGATGLTYASQNISQNMLNTYFSKVKY